MRVAIRADASVAIGSGHVMRCATLGDELERQGADVTFVCRNTRGSLADWVEQKGFRVKLLPEPARAEAAHHASHPLAPSMSIEDCLQDAGETASALRADSPRFDWLVVDHYGLAEEWEQAVRASATRIFVIDDLADRRHDCDLLLDQNFVEHLDRRYDTLVPVGARLLLGPRYALLRREFLGAADRPRQPAPGRTLRLFVFFGGTDPTGETLKALRALDRLKLPIQADVVVGAGNPRGSDIAAWCRSRDGLSFHRQIDNMAALMSTADLALCAGGATTWERCFLGLPALVVSVAANQIDVTRAVARTGAQTDLGWHEQVDETGIAGEIERLAAAPHLLGTMSAVGTGLMGGRDFRGTAGVVAAMMS